LQQALKSTDSEYEHPDLETLPIILGILKDLIKSTQPGIEAADSKVKFWALCESLVFPKNEIIVCFPFVMILIEKLIRLSLRIWICMTKAGH